jgi:hypothetical protein
MKHLKMTVLLLITNLKRDDLGFDLENMENESDRNKISLNERSVLL